MDICSIGTTIHIMSAYYIGTKCTCTLSIANIPVLSKLIINECFATVSRFFLKGHAHKIFDVGFINEKAPPGPNRDVQGPF